MTVQSTKGRIASGFYRVIERLGGMSDTLSIAGSYGDTLTDEQVAEELEAWLAANPQSPAPEGGAVWPEVTDAWADTYCALTGRDPDGQQVTFVDGGVATTFRNVAKREIEAMLCAAPKTAVASLATREEAPAEPVSDRYKFDDEIAWLREAARYFSARDTKGEDRAHWANVYNAENARKLADRLAELSSNPCQLAVATSSEASPCPFCGCGMRVNYDPESEMYGPDGDHLPGCIIGNWDLHEYAFRPDALAAWNSRARSSAPPAREDAQRVAEEQTNHLTWAITWARMIAEGRAASPTEAAATCLEYLLKVVAQPPAREDAQPVHCHHEAYQGYCAHCGVKIVNGFAITPKPHPAPDALRAKGEELVIALKRYGFPVSGAATVNLGAFGSSEAMAVDFTTREFIQALAALQAEQKGGA